MATPTILCAAYGGGHVNACAPVAGELARRGWNVHFLALTTAYAKVADGPFPVLQARDLIGDADADIIAQGERLAGDTPEGGPVSREESVAYHGLGYHDLVQIHGEQQAAALYAAEGRAAFEHGELARRAIDLIGPDIVLTTNSPRAEKALIDLAQARAIPAAVLNDTLASATNFWLHEPHYADRICVLSDSVKDVLVASGHRAGKIVVTGNPALEPMNALARVRRDRSSPQRPVVLYASQPLTKADSTHKAQVVEALREFAAKRPDIEVRARLHPNEDASPEWLAPPIGHVQGATLAVDLLGADVLVTHGSTVGIEAALAGIPVVLQKGSSVADSSRFEEYGIALASEDVTDLPAAIDRALAQGFATSFSMPPNACDRVVAVLEEMIDTQ